MGEFLTFTSTQQQLHLTAFCAGMCALLTSPVDRWQLKA
jgi:hypothetical protein